jgi:hypothetical protein
MSGVDLSFMKNTETSDSGIIIAQWPFKTKIFW